MTETAPALPSRKQVALGSAIGAGVAAIALVFFALPAEFGVDPTGFGEATGLTGLSRAGGAAENIYLKRGQARANVVLPLAPGAAIDEATLRATLAARGIALPAGTPIRTDRFVYELPPFEGIELKYELARGAPMAFRWSAATPLYYDMHSHPHAGGVDATESYAIAEAPAQAAVYVAPFTGIHGWYWQNRTLQPVTLTLDTAGAIVRSMTFDQAGEHSRALTPPQPD